MVNRLSGNCIDQVESCRHVKITFPYIKKEREGGELEGVVA